MKQFVVINHVRIHNANAISSPYTIGFPAMTAWLGAVHVLQRCLWQRGFAEVALTKTAIACHQCNVQTYRGKNDYVNSIIGTGNPLTKDGERASFIEEGRCHLNISLLIETKGITGDNKEACLAVMQEQIHKMKMAGGDILSVGNIRIEAVDDDDEQQVRRLLGRLMPGYVLIERRDLMTTAMLAGHDAIDALLEYLKVTYEPEAMAEQLPKKWQAPQRKAPGWIVPIAVGFRGISALGKVKHQRDEHTKHRFAESIVTLGEFIMPYRIQCIEDILWQYNVNEEQGLYVCKNQQ